ncbi:hypothetical protein KRE48_14315, partial [Elizabethkingia meningoseptica]|nr:hypothetical protein [Elizabethkingia meningoseptica]
FRTQKLSPPAPMVLLTRESRSPPVFIFEKPLHVNAEAFSFGTCTNIINITNLPAITTTLRMKSYGVIKVMIAEKVIKEKLYVILNNKLITLNS